jgi:hypothetical protein
MISSSLIHDCYDRVLPDYEEYRQRLKKQNA